MGWIKRNLLFVIGGVIALALLGAAAYYCYGNWSRNSKAFNQLNEIYTSLQNYAQQKPAPGNDKIDNTKIARAQERRLHNWETNAATSFEPIAPIPPGANVSSAAFANALRHTIDQLQHDAANGGVMLPPNYDFSFTAQRQKVIFAPGLDLLSAQLGEVKAIAEVLFDARINTLDGIQRSRVSDDDINGPQADYIDQHPTTNELAVIAPYVVTFRSFTPELAKVVAGFSTSSNAFIIKAINIQPASPSAGTAGTEGMNGAPPMGIPGEMPRPGFPPMGTPPAAPRGALPTVVKEQLLRITMEVDLIKLLPKK